MLKVETVKVAQLLRWWFRDSWFPLRYRKHMSGATITALLGEVAFGQPGGTKAVGGIEIVLGTRSAGIRPVLLRTTIPH